MSATLVGTVRGYFAICNVLAPGGTLGAARGVASVAKNGAGDYTLTLQDGVSLNDGGVALATAQGATPACCAVEQVDLTHLRVRTTDAAGAALDVSFSLAIQDIGPS